MAIPRLQHIPLEPGEWEDITRALRPFRAPPEAQQAVEHGIACYRATADGAIDCTVANALLTMELLASPRRQQEALQVIAHERSMLDSGSSDRMDRDAAAALAGDAAALGRVLAAAEARIEELRRHERVTTKGEALRIFCAYTREVWSSCTGRSLRTYPNDEDFRNCMRFARAVLTTAGVPTDEYVNHPAKLRDLLLSEF